MIVWRTVIRLIWVFVASSLLVGCGSTTSDLGPTAATGESTLIYALSTTPSATAVVTATAEASEIWTWVVTQNEKVSYLYCENKPVFANGAAECQHEDGSTTFVPQGPLVEVLPGRVEKIQPNADIVTWVITVNDEVTHLYCLNKPSFSSGMAECLKEDGQSTFVNQGPIIDVEEGRVVLQQDLGEYTWIVVQPPPLRIGQMYCTNPPVVVNTYAECRHPNGTSSYVSQSVPIIAVPGFDN